MTEPSKRPADVSNIQKTIRPGAPTGETARAADSVPVASAPFAALPKQLGRYRIDRLLGKGAMGAVYLALDTQLDRSVALKVARVSSAGSSKLIQRMETEAKAAARVDHPLICKVYEFGEIDGIRFIALQYIEGEDLKTYFNRLGRKRPAKEAIELVLQVAGALKAAHDQQIIHRDLKPENIMLNRKGKPVIMDFGLARQMASATNAGLTQGMILGTAAYMSPEQAIGKAEGIDHRTDLYALGVMLFEMLTGEWPFTGSAIEVMGRKCVQDPPSPRTVNSTVPFQLAEVCHKAIAQKRENRFANSAEFIAALERVDLTAVEEEPSFAWDEELPVIATSIRSRRIVKKNGRHNLTMTQWWNGLPSALRWAMVGSAAACLMFLGAILFFRNGDALVKVEVHADDLEVTFQNDTFTLADGIRRFKVKPGDQTLHIKSAAIEFDTDKFTLNRGDNPAVTVELMKSEIVAKFGNQEVGRRAASIDSAQPQKDADRHTIQPSTNVEANDSSPSTAHDPLASAVVKSSGTPAGETKPILTSMLEQPETSSVQNETKMKQREERLEYVKQMVARYKNGHVVVGKVVLDDGENPAFVTSHMPILDDGYFAWAAGTLNLPLRFRMHGYAPVEVQFKSDSGDFVDVGAVTLHRLSKDELVPFKGRIVLEGSDNPRQASVSLLVSTYSPGMTVSYGTEPFTKWSKWPAPIKIQISDDGSIEASGFSPTDYWCRFEAPGYVSQSSYVDFRPKSGADVGEIFLEKARRVVLEHITSESETFDSRNTKTQSFTGGERWTETPQRWDLLTFKQLKGRIQFDYFSGPCLIADLGVGELKKFLNVKIARAKDDPRTIAVRSGHVYLLKGPFKYNAIFKVVELEEGSVVAEQPRKDVPAIKSATPFNSVFKDLNPNEYQQAFGIAAKRGLRPSKLKLSVGNGTVLYSGRFIPLEVPNLEWQARHGQTTEAFNQSHAEYAAQGFKLECHESVLLDRETIHVAVWVKK